MLQQIFRVLLILAVGVGVISLWGSLALWVNQDVRRRRIERADRWYWTAMAIVLGPVGVGVYILGRWMTPRFTAPYQMDERIERGITFPQPGPSFGEQMQTQPADRYADHSNLNPNLVHIHSNPQDLPGGYYLEVVEGPDMGQVFPLDILPLQIGRGPDIQIRLDRDRTVSRKHAVIYEEDGLIHIRDLMSMQGIMVNGLVVLEQVLYPGDRIQVGRSALQLTSGQKRGR